MRRYGLVLFLLAALTACAPRGLIAIVPMAMDAGTPHRIFVTTTRSRDDTGAYSADRSADVSFAEFTVSVPPDRRPGEIAFPKGEPDPQSEFVTVSTKDFDSRDGFRSALGAALRAKQPGDRELLIYVHGFNNTFAEGLYRAAQLSHDFRVNGVMLHYSWPSLGNPFGYAHDRDSALFARAGFAEMLDTARQAGAEDIVILAHSMGSLLTMETLRQVALEQPGRVARDISAVVLFSPDIDVDVFHAQVRDIGSLPENFIIFTSERDRALRLSARLTGQRERLGNLATAEDVADLDVTLLDVTQFSRGLGHFTPGSSETLINVLSDVANLASAFNKDQTGRPGLLPGTVLTVQNATEVILSPLIGLPVQ